MNTIEDIKNYMGGDNEDTPVNPKSIQHMQYLIDKCTENNLQQPEIFPWYGGDGVQAEWDSDQGLYIEVDSSSEGISILLVENRDYNHSKSINTTTIEDAFIKIEKYLK